MFRWNWKDNIVNESAEHLCMHSCTLSFLLFVNNFSFHDMTGCINLQYFYRGFFFSVFLQLSKTCLCKSYFLVFQNFSADQNFNRQRIRFCWSILSDHSKKIIHYQILLVRTELLKKSTIRHNVQEGDLWRKSIKKINISKLLTVYFSVVLWGSIWNIPYIVNICIVFTDK